MEPANQFKLETYGLTLISFFRNKRKQWLMCVLLLFGNILNYPKDSPFNLFHFPYHIVGPSMGMPLEAVSFPTPNFPEFPNPFGNKLLAYFPTSTPLHFQLRKGNRNRNRHWNTSSTKWVCKAYYVSLLAQTGHLPPACLKLNADSDTFAHCRLPTAASDICVCFNFKHTRK